jgi:molybdopterin converting factor small subunit
MTFVLSGNLRRLAGFQNEIEASGTTLGECVDDMVGRNPRLGPVLLDAEGKMRGIIRVFVNGTQLASATPNVPVAAADCVSLITAIAGG